MSVIEKPHLGDIDYKLTVQFLIDIDLTDVSTVVLYIRKPKVGGGYEEVTWDAFIESAPNGTVYYITILNDLDMIGFYTVSALVSYNGGGQIRADAFPWRIWGIYEY